MLLHLLIPCGMTIVNLFISFINSLRADAFCGCMHDMELTLFQALHCSSLAVVTGCRCRLKCSTIGFIMHSLGVCPAMVHCTSTPCIYIYILYLFCSHNIITFTVQPCKNARPSRMHPSQQVLRAFSLSASCLFVSSIPEQQNVIRMM